MKEEILTLKAPAPIGPYSQAIRAGNFVFLSGQIPIIPETGEVEKGDVEVQMERIMKNILSILEASDMGFDDIVKVNIFLNDLSSFSKVNEVYERYFKNPILLEQLWK